MYEVVWSMVARIRDSLRGLGALVFYMGGDNVIAVMEPRLDEAMLEALASSLRARVGVGVASRARDAVRLATEALDGLRRSSGVVRVLVEDS